uniref:Uncharacterized protein n=1 Tax=Strigamia maritima TaxID=126957 RepID=T1ILT3_STRMM
MLFMAIYNYETPHAFSICTSFDVHGKYMWVLFIIICASYLLLTHSPVLVKFKL